MALEVTLEKWLWNNKLNLNLSKTTFMIVSPMKKLGWPTAGPALRGGQGGLVPPINMLDPPINKLSLLKTAAFVLNFKFWPPLINAWTP